MLHQYPKTFKESQYKQSTFKKNHLEVYKHTHTHTHRAHIESSGPALYTELCDYFPLSPTAACPRVPCTFMAHGGITIGGKRDHPRVCVCVCVCVGSLKIMSVESAIESDSVVPWWWL